MIENILSVNNKTIKTLKQIQIYDYIYVQTADIERKKYKKNWRVDVCTYVYCYLKKQGRVNIFRANIKRQHSLHSEVLMDIVPQIKMKKVH